MNVACVCELYWRREGEGEGGRKGGRGRGRGREGGRERERERERERDVSVLFHFLSPATPSGRVAMTTGDDDRTEVCMYHHILAR